MCHESELGNYVRSNSWLVQRGNGVSTIDVSILA